MTLNCKPGDLAIVVKISSEDTHAKMLGKVVRVTRLICGTFWCYEGPHFFIPYSGEISAEILAIGDDFLRPLRDSDEPDETLAWAGKPAINWTQRAKEQLKGLSV